MIMGLWVGAAVLVVVDVPVARLTGARVFVAGGGGWGVLVGMRVGVRVSVGGAGRTHWPVTLLLFPT